MICDFVATENIRQGTPGQGDAVDKTKSIVYED